MIQSPSGYTGLHSFSFLVLKKKMHTETNKIQQKIMLHYIALLHSLQSGLSQNDLKDRPKPIYPFKAGHQDYLHNSFLQITVTSHFIREIPTTL